MIAMSGAAKEPMRQRILRRGSPAAVLGTPPPGSRLRGRAGGTSGLRRSRIARSA